MNVKKITAITMSFILVLVMIPMLYYVIYRSAQVNPEQETKKLTFQSQQSFQVEPEEAMVTVFRVEKNEYHDLPLEEYLVGVVSGEMPASYELEALKAQAVAARTYTLNIMETESAIYDTVQHQVYMDQAQLKERWGNDFDEYYNKVKQAVDETEGEIIEYNGERITPLYFSISNGYTENSEDYWDNEIPYLKSVSSEWDKTAPKYEEVVEFDLKTLRTKFNNSKLTKKDFTILSRTEGKKVDEVLIGNKVYSGREVRELLGLRSSDFTFEFKDNKMLITTRGYGHGVGMSQYGADQLAKMGKSYQQILQYYYQNINIIEINT